MSSAVSSSGSGRRLAIAAVGLPLAGLGLLALASPEVIVSLGRNIPQQDVLTDYVIGLVGAGVIGLSIPLWPVRPGDKKYLLWAWAAKTVVTMGFMLFYEAHYAGVDMYGYFWGSTHKWFYWNALVLGDGSLNMRELCWLHAQFLPDSFHLMKVDCALAGFIAIYLFYRAAVRFLGREDIRIFLALSLFPSILFWSAILGKDPIILLGIALYAYGTASWYQTRRFRYLWLVCLGIWGTMVFRIWMGPILLAPLGVFLLSRARGLLSKALFAAAFTALFFVATRQFQSYMGERNISFDTAADAVSSIDGLVNTTGWDGGSHLRWEGRMTGFGSMALFAPMGAFTALFRPLPGDVANAFGWLAGFENVGLLWLLWRAIKRSRRRDLSDPKVLWALILVLTWATSYGFVSYQNLGAAVRYRLQILPILLALLLYLQRSEISGNDEREVEPCAA